MTTHLDPAESLLGFPQPKIRRRSTDVEPASSTVDGVIVEDPHWALARRRNGSVVPAEYRRAAGRVAVRGAVVTVRVGGKAGTRVLGDTASGLGTLVDRYMDWLWVSHLREDGRRWRVPQAKYHGVIGSAIRTRVIVSGVAVAVVGGVEFIDLSNPGSHKVTWGVAGAVTFACWLRGVVTRKRHQAAVKRAQGEFKTPTKGGVPGEETLTRVFQDAGVLRAPTVNQVGEVTKPGQALRRIEKHFCGHYWEVVVEMPSGVAFGAVLAKHAQVASAFGSDTSKVFLTRVKGFEGRVKLTVFSEDPYDGPPIPSPLAVASHASPWEQNRIGQTATSDLVTLCLFESSLLIGSMPGYGKTSLVRVVASPGVLDPYARFVLFDGKPDNIDNAAFEMVAETFVQGADNEQAWKLLETLDKLFAEGQNRFREFKRLGRRRIPAGKLTREVHEDATLPDLALTFLILDEVHLYLSNGTMTNRVNDEGQKMTLGAAITARLVEILKTPGRAGGIIPILATQDVNDGGLPSEIRKVIGTRVGFYMDTYRESNAILGEGKASAGWDCSHESMMTAGVGIIRRGRFPMGESPFLKAKFDFMSQDEGWSVFERGRHLRQQAGTLRGDALNWVPPEHRPDVEWVEEAEPVPTDLPEVLARTVAYVRDCVDGGDDRELIPSVELYEEAGIADIEVDGEPMSQTRHGRELTRMGIGREVEPGRGGRVARRVADIVAAAARVEAGGAVYIVNDTAEGAA